MPQKPAPGLDWSHGEKVEINHFQSLEKSIDPRLCFLTLDPSDKNIPSHYYVYIILRTYENYNDSNSKVLTKQTCVGTQHVLKIKFLRSVINPLKGDSSKSFEDFFLLILKRTHKDNRIEDEWMHTNYFRIVFPQFMASFLQSKEEVPDILNRETEEKLYSSTDRILQYCGTLIGSPENENSSGSENRNILPVEENFEPNENFPPPQEQNVFQAEIPNIFQNEEVNPYMQFSMNETQNINNNNNYDPNYHVQTYTSYTDPNLLQALNYHNILVQENINLNREMKEFFKTMFTPDPNVPNFILEAEKELDITIKKMKKELVQE